MGVLTTEQYLNHLRYAIKEMRRLHSGLTLTLDANDLFFVRCPSVEFKENHDGMFGGSPPLFRSSDPLECIKGTLKRWYAIRPPAFLYVNKRRVMYVDHEWVFIDPLPKDKDEDATL
jgi:hypothetical protein